MPFNSAPISVKDSSGDVKPMIAFNDGTNNAFANAQLDATGALISPATSALQTAGNASLTAIASQTAGAATAANQVSTNNKLDTVIARTPALGSTTSANATPVVIASDQGALPFAATANTAGGASTFCANGASGGNALLTNNPVAVKSSAGNLYGFDFVNTGAAAAFVQIFDLAVGAVTLGTTVAKMSKWVPAGGAWEEKFGGEGKISFTNAITVAATTTASGNTAPATGILANVTFK